RPRRARRRDRRARRSAANAMPDGCSWRSDHNKSIIVENEMCRLGGRHLTTFYWSAEGCQPDGRVSRAQRSMSEANGALQTRDRCEPGALNGPLARERQSLRGAYTTPSSTCHADRCGCFGAEAGSMWTGRAGLLRLSLAIM